MCLFKKSSKRNLASERLIRQILGSLLKRWWLVAMILVLGSLIYFSPEDIINCAWCHLLLLTLVVWLVISVCQSLTNIFNLRKQENGITWCQIFILIAIGIWIIGFLLIFNISKDSRYFVVLGIVGSLLAFIFQDALKGAIAFIHLRMNNLLCIDDWIKVPKYNVDGEVKRVTLTTVTVYNWDTTTASFPTSALYSDHFINLQKMTDGKTYGRQMIGSFIIDTSWIHPLSAKEAEHLKQKMFSENKCEYLPEEEIKEGELNAKLFRLYLYHWLMNHPHVSQMPRLLVRWLSQVDNGMPLELYAFITEGGLAAFEWQRSQIIEHVMVSLEWFGLQLYQSPSAYDVSNSNVYLTNESVKYRKEDCNE